MQTRNSRPSYSQQSYHYHGDPSWQKQALHFIGKATVYVGVVTTLLFTLAEAFREMEKVRGHWR